MERSYWTDAYFYSYNPPSFPEGMVHHEHGIVIDLPPLTASIA